MPRRVPNSARRTANVIAGVLCVVRAVYRSLLYGPLALLQRPPFPPNGGPSKAGEPLLYMGTDGAPVSGAPTRRPKGRRGPIFWLPAVRVQSSTSDSHRP